MSQAELGERVGLSGARIAQIEQGGTPRLNKVGLIAKALKSDVATLFGKVVARDAEGVKQSKERQTRQVTAKPTTRRTTARLNPKSTSRRALLQAAA